MCFHTKVTPSFNTFLYSRNGLQDPQCSFSFFSFYLPSIYKLCRTTKEPCSRILCFAEDINCKRVLNIDRKKKKTATNCKRNTSSPIVKPSCPSAAQSVQDEHWSPAPSLHELSPARVGAQP